MNYKGKRRKRLGPEALVTIGLILIAFSLVFFSVTLIMDKIANYKVQKALEERREQSKNMAIQKALEHMAIGEQIAEEMANKKQTSNPKKQNAKVPNNQNPLPPTGDMPPIPPPPEMPPRSAQGCGLRPHRRR